MIPELASMKISPYENKTVEKNPKEKSNQIFVVCDSLFGKCTQILITLASIFIKDIFTDA